MFAELFFGSRRAVMERACQKIKFVRIHTANGVKPLRNTAKEVDESVLLCIVDQQSA